MDLNCGVDRRVLLDLQCEDGGLGGRLAVRVRVDWVEIWQSRCRNGDGHQGHRLFGKVFGGGVVLPRIEQPFLAETPATIMILSLAIYDRTNDFQPCILRGLLFTGKTEEAKGHGGRCPETAEDLSRQETAWSLDCDMEGGIPVPISIPSIAFIQVGYVLQVSAQPPQSNRMPQGVR